MNDLINDLVLWAQAVDWIRFWITAALFVLPPLVVMFVTLFAGKHVVAAARTLYAWVRPYIDEPSDPVIAMLAARSGLAPDRVIELVTDNLDSVLLAITPAVTKASLGQAVGTIHVSVETDGKAQSAESGEAIPPAEAMH